MPESGSPTGHSPKHGRKEVIVLGDRVTKLVTSDVCMQDSHPVVTDLRRVWMLGAVLQLSNPWTLL